MRTTIFIGITAALLFFCGFTRCAAGSERAGIANPAAAYCVESGYTVQTRDKPDKSQYNVCIFPDGNECEQWAFFKGECGASYKMLPDPPKENSCMTDEDCTCGTHIQTGKCFAGNKMYVNTKKQCPDYCSSIAGNLTIACVGGECKQMAR